MGESPWKEAIREYFEEFMEFFFPDIHEEIDYELGYEFLDKEFEKVVREQEIGEKRADILVKVSLKNGEEKWLLIHVEVQGYYEQAFSKRMYIYNYRIFDRYGIDVVSLAILLDSSRSYRPSCYERRFKGFELRFKFPVVKVIDYRERWDELEETGNSFGILVMSYLKELESRKDFDEKLFWKITFVKRLYEAGYERDKILRLYRFIDWTMELPEELTERFHDAIIRYEEEKKMPYITTAERIGIKKGILQNAREAVMDILELRFGVIPESIVNRLNEIYDPSILKILLRKAVKVQGIEEIEKALRN
jgi:hypothetical protein